MDWEGLKRKLAAEHYNEPQTLGRLEVALRSAQEALQILSGHGHHFHLADGPGKPYPEWPRTLFHVDLAPNGRLVYTEWEAKDLGPGWFDTLQKAQHWDGVETQFNGRGGVPKSPRALEATGQKSDSQAAVDKFLSDMRQRAIEEFKARNRWGGQSAKPDSERASNDGSGETQSEVREENGNLAESGLGLRVRRQGNGKIPGNAEAFEEALEEMNNPPGEEQ